MKKYYKYIILIITLVVCFSLVSVEARIGYTYSHSGEPIYSSVGYSVSSDGIYTIISDAWINEKGERLPAYLFKSPEDMFIYTEKNLDGQKIDDVIYIVDSQSNNLFVFDGNLKYQYRLNKFEVKPENLTSAEILAAKTTKVEYNSDGSVKSTTSIASSSSFNRCRIANSDVLFTASC